MRALRRRAPHVELSRVGKPGAPACGSLDPELLRWCEEHHALLISCDRTTMPGHFADHVASGRTCWGVLLLRPRPSLARCLDDLIAIVGASSAEDWQGVLDYLPFEADSR